MKTTNIPFLGNPEKTSDEQKLYFSLSDGGDISGLVVELSGAIEHIQTDVNNLHPDDMKEMQYTLTPVWMTEEEFKNLPEYQY